jgi:uncharacterized protein (DUF433 family)
MSTMETNANGVIIDRGRGPEIAGTRVTIYDVLGYVQAGWQPLAIAATLSLTPAQVEAVIEYIEEHKTQVLAIHRNIQERIAQGNPPAIQAKLDAIHASYHALWADRLGLSDQHSSSEVMPQSAQFSIDNPGTIR